MTSRNCSLSFRLGVFVLFMVAYGILYVIPNFFIEQPAQELPLLWIDRALPLMPWTFLIYTSDYFVFVIALFIMKDRNQFLSFARMMFGVLLICGLFFYFYPTTYPRPEYLPQSSRLLEAVMQFVAVADSPRNCFPSMHVGLTAVATWAFRHQGPKVFLGFVIWSLAIFISTLTTKQHYFLDILGGLAVMGTIATLENALFSRQKVAALLAPLLRKSNNGR